MAEIITMPRLSDTMEEGTVVKWHKNVGDKIAEGDILAEIETDKAIQEFESEFDGVLLYQGVAEGVSTNVDDVLAIIGNEGEDISGLIGGGAKATTEDKEEKSSISVQKEEKSIKISPKLAETEKPQWKPMGFVSNTPDSLINKKSDLQLEEKETETETETETPKQEITEQKTEERPVFNVSFFTQKVSPIETEETKEKIIETVQKQETTSENNKNSNIPNFINTWQNWLKIDKKEAGINQKSTVSKEEIKNQVIENFIENEPKISKLKEDSEFIVKEKSNDISHLMTETLAKLYIEQKLYSKAIKAYEILIEKHPVKENQFKNKIQEIKELRKNP